MLYIQSFRISSENLSYEIFYLQQTICEKNNKIKFIFCLFFDIFLYIKYNGRPHTMLKQGMILTQYSLRLFENVKPGQLEQSLIFFDDRLDCCH